MSAEDFKAWIAHLGISQKRAAAVLGLSERTVAYYLSGRKIPLTVELACEALEARWGKP